MTWEEAAGGLVRLSAGDLPRIQIIEKILGISAKLQFYNNGKTYLDIFLTFYINFYTYIQHSTLFIPPLIVNECVIWLIDNTQDQSHAALCQQTIL